MNFPPTQQPLLCEPSTILDEFSASLSPKSTATIESYRRAVRQMLVWLRERPGQENGFHPDQRYALRSVVEREGSLRSAALFALGYWAGCRVSDVSWLRLADTHLTRKAGWIQVGHKGGKTRTLDLVNAARRALDQYLTREQQESPPNPLQEHQHHPQPYSHMHPAQPARPVGREFVFASQRQNRLTEAGIHHWLRALKQRATKAEWDLIHDVTFHDLRHDFAHRAREAGWGLEEVAYYLGHITKKGTPAIQTTVRYTQVSREQVAAKLHLLNT